MTASRFLAVLLSGALFGFGLSVAGMVSPEVVLGFLRLQDWGLMLVMGGAMGVTLLVYQFVPGLLGAPLLGGTFRVRVAQLDRKTVVGAAVFGIGWGLCGVCPGPAIAGLGVGNLSMLIAVGGIAAGAYLQARFF
jgi:uncharacterized membrane protein YedE/YeeE